MTDLAARVVRRFKAMDLREYAEEEWEEYDNAFTRPQFPDAFSSEGAFIEAVSRGVMAPVVSFKGVENTDADGQRVGDYEQLETTMWQNKGANFAEEGRPKFYEWLGDIISSVKDGSAPPSIVGVHGDGTYYLLAGNTRATVAKYLGVPARVIYIPLRGRHLPPPVAR
jgi:hypothetical protein